MVLLSEVCKCVVNCADLHISWLVPALVAFVRAVATCMFCHHALFISHRYQLLAWKSLGQVFLSFLGKYLLHSWPGLVSNMLKRRFQVIPIHSLEETGPFQARQGRSERRIALEYSLQHLIARGVEIPWPVDLDSGDILQSLRNGCTLEWIETTDKLTDQNAPAPHISRVGVASRPRQAIVIRLAFY